MAKDLVWLITGCSTGIGREIARKVISDGYKVVVTARDAAKVADLAADHDQVLPLALDVTRPDQVDAVVRQTLDHFGRIDVLVNNAGVGYFSSVEEGHEPTARRIFDINFWGLINVTKAVLPHMRGQAGGHVINISSLGGLTTYPGIGYYHATKFAVEGISETMAQEVAPLGIKVTLIEPSSFRTDWAGRSASETTTEIEGYKPTVGYITTMSRRYVGYEPGDPAKLAAAVIKVAESETPPLRLLLGNRAYNTAVEKYSKFLSDIEAWKEISLGVDFEPGAH